MKKIILIFIASIICFFSFGQNFPGYQSFGNATTLVESKGGFRSVIGFINTTYLDTTTANLNPYIVNYPGAQIRTISPTNTVWLRNADATGWIQFATGVISNTNIYNSSGVLTSTRTLDLNGFGLTFQGDAPGPGVSFDLNAAVGGFQAAANTVMLSGDSVKLQGSNSARSSFIVKNDTIIFKPFQGRIYIDSLERVEDSSGLDIQAFNRSTGQWVRMPSDIIGSAGVLDTSQFIGLRYGYNFATTPFAGGFTDNTPVTTITAGGANTVFAGGTYAAGNNISQPFYMGVENFTITQDIVCGTINNTSYGLSFNLTGSVGGTASLGGFYLLSDTMLRVAYTATGLLPTYSDLSSRETTNFIVTTGDTLRLKFQRKDKVVTTTMTNLRNDVEAEVSIDDQYCTVGLFSIGFYGGSWTFIDSLKITYDDVKYAQVGGSGNSIFSGATADNESVDWWNRATEGVAGGTIHMGAGFEQSLHGTYRMDDILNYAKPKTLLIEYGVNDLIQSVNIDSFSNRIQRMVAPSIAAGIVPVLIGIVPNQLDGTVYNDTLRAIALRYNIEFVDVFTTMKIAAGTTINPIYGPGGGDPHPYQYGHNLMGNQIKDQVSYLWTTPAVLNIKGLPTVISPKYYMAQDENGNIGKAYNSFSNDYIQNLQFQNGLALTDAQDADIFINGGAYMAGPLVVQGNSGSLSNPTFNAAANGITTASTLVAGTFSSGNFSIATVPSLASGNFLWAGGAQILGNSTFIVMMNNPGGNGISFGLTVDNNTAPTLFDYSPQRWRNNGTTVAFMDRMGGLHTDSVSGYNYNNSSLYTAQSWTSKKYVDSVVALAGGSAAISSLTAAAGTNTINNAALEQEWQWNTLAGTEGLHLSSTSTAAASDAQILFRSSLSGANGTAGQFTVAVAGYNTHTGSTSENVGLAGYASGATYNYSVWANEQLSVGAASIAAGSASRAVMVRSLSNVFSEGAISYPNANYGTSLEIGYGGILTSADFTLSVVGGDATINSAQSAFGGVFDPTAKVHIAAGSATAGTAPEKKTTGTLLTTPEVGAEEYDNAQYNTTNALNRYGLNGVIANSSALVSNSGTSATTLFTYTTKASTLAATDEMIYGTINGSFADNAGTETLTLTFAGTNIFNQSGLAGNDRPWNMTYEIVRTGASTATAFVTFLSALEIIKTNTFLTGLTFTNTNILVLTGTSSNATTDAIRKENFRVNWTPASAN